MTVFDTNSPSSTQARQMPQRPTLLQRMNVWRSRRDLAALSTDSLNDIGLTRETAQREADKHFWDVPSSWKQ